MVLFRSLICVYVVRHYYRCTTHDGCSAKRHVTWSSNNTPTIVAFGEHEHSSETLGDEASKKRRIGLSTDEQEDIPLVPDLYKFLSSQVWQLIVLLVTLLTLLQANKYELVACVAMRDAVNDGYLWSNTSEDKFMCSSIGCSGECALHFVFCLEFQVCCYSHQRIVARPIVWFY
jgi:hypothetical protein